MNPSVDPFPPSSIKILYGTNYRATNRRCIVHISVSPVFERFKANGKASLQRAHSLLFLRGDPIGASRANRISEKKRKKKEEHLQKRNPPSLILEFQPRDSNRFLSPMGIEYTTDPFLILIADDDKFADLQHFEQNSSIMCTVKVT